MIYHTIVLLHTVEQSKIEFSCNIKEAVYLQPILTY